MKLKKKKIETRKMEIKIRKFFWIENVISKGRIYMLNILHTQGQNNGD